MPHPVPRLLTTHAELLLASGGHPFVRYEIPADRPLEGYAVGNPPDGAVAVVRRTLNGRVGLNLLGASDAVGALLADPVIADWLVSLSVATLSVPADAAHHVTGPALGPGHDWEWMWTTSEPPGLDAERLLAPLDEQHTAELRMLLDEDNPRTFGAPFARAGQHWVGARGDDGRLVACGCREPSPSGAPSLTGITVAAGQRGRGLGAAVTARLTREALPGAGVCTLGMYADNDRARGIYHRLGYVTGVSFSTHLLVPGPELSNSRRRPGA